jgi:g-D-glutamyl-meso-diaminopimelate peptidase
MKRAELNWTLLPPDNTRREALTRSLCSQYRDCLERGTLATTLCTRRIDYLQVGNQKNPVLFAGAFHGMEWLTTLLLLRFTANLCKAYHMGKKIAGVDVAPFLRRRGLVVVPCVNPDGVEIALHGTVAAGPFCELVYHASHGDPSTWQANARGVDLNHNYPADWEALHHMEQKAGILGPAPTRYGGAYPESEPETQGMIGLCRAKQFHHALAFHSQGEEIYWNYGPYTPERAELMARVMATSSGYLVSEPEGLACGGGFKDWFITEFHRPAFTIEIGKGQNPLPLSDLDEIYYTLEEMMVLSVIM